MESLELRGGDGATVYNEVREGGREEEGWKGEEKGRKGGEKGRKGGEKRWNEGKMCSGNVL